MNCPRLKYYVSTLWFDHNLKMFFKKKKDFEGFKDLTIVCPSEWLAAYTRQSFLSCYHIQVIHNGIDTSVFFPRDTKAIRERLHILDEEKVILSVAPNLMSNSKGGKWVIELSNLFKDKRIKFILVGVDNLDVPHGDNVLLFSRTSNQNELAEFYSLADLFVICSEMENFPTTCLEAQCCGTPICGFDVGGTKETSIGQKDNFVKYGDLSGLAGIVSHQSRKSERESFALSGDASLKFSKRQ